MIILPGVRGNARRDDVGAKRCERMSDREDFCPVKLLDLAVVYDLVVHLDHQFVRCVRSSLLHHDPKRVLVSDNHILASGDPDAHIVVIRGLAD